MWLQNKRDPETPKIGDLVLDILCIGAWFLAATIALSTCPRACEVSVPPVLQESDPRE